MLNKSILSKYCVSFRIVCAVEEQTVVSRNKVELAVLLKLDTMCVEIAISSVYMWIVMDHSSTMYNKISQMKKSEKPMRKM
jgi:hypothetical protein